MWKTTEGSTGRLVQLCFGYFLFYVITGVAVKYFTGHANAGFPGMNQIEYLVYSTIGGNLTCLIVVFAFGWYHFKATRMTTFLGIKMPAEFPYIFFSGICTAIIIPGTTLMYTFEGLSVMVAMVMMRGSIIVVSRLVDALQVKQGILHKKVYWQENIAVVFAILAVAMQLFFGKEGEVGFDFIHNVGAVTTLSCYILAYAFRIYIMNYYKNTRPKGVQLDNKGFFAIEQIAASVVMLAAGLILFYSTGNADDSKQLASYHASLADPKTLWHIAIISGIAYGMVAFFSVFIFMFKGRTATFAGLVNRLTSLVAGTAATLIAWYALGGKAPSNQDWYSLAAILAAVGFLSVAERKRTAELAANKEI
jgi:hypothetical protein